MKESYFSRFFGMSFLAAAFALTSCGKSSTEDKPTPKPKTPVVVGPSESQTALQNTTDQKTFEFNQQFNEQYTKHGIAVDLPSFATHGFELKRRTDEVLARANQLLELFVEMPTHELSFDNAIKFIDVTIYRISEVYGQAYLLMSVSKDPQMREMARASVQKFQDWFVHFESRKDIYAQIKTFAETKPDLKGADKILLNDLLKTYESQGFQYPKERQAQIQALKKELTQHSTEWRTQLAKANQKTLVITAEELKGTPDTILERMASLKNDDGTYTLRMGVSLDSFNVLTNSPNEALRKKVFMARYNRAKDTNFDVMAKIVQGRVRLAKLLGHDSWAASRLEDKMAKNTDTALGFVTDLAAKLRPKFEAEIEELRKIKATETNNANAKIEPWDVFYFTSQYEKKQFQIDENELRKYFEYNHVFDAMVKHYESIFSINVKKVQAPYTWDEKVELLELRDAEKDQILGFLYLDMFPRPADEKYGHFAMFGFRDGITFGNGIKRAPMAALVCNFPEAAEGKPALLSLDNVETLFHEFGHGLHQLLSQAEHSSQAGTNVPRDFVEAPSQFLEYFVTDKKAVQKISKHIEDGSFIDGDTLDKIKASKQATVGISYTRQMAYATMDLKIYSEISDENVSSQEIVDLSNGVFANVYLAYPEGSAWITNFNHILGGGYDAGYYGYGWSDVIAADIASEFESSPHGYYDKELGKKYRKHILESGSSRSVEESIENFLGRPFNNKAFLKNLGLDG